MDLRQRFQGIVDQHYESVWACVSVLTARSDETEDLVHQAFMIAFERLADGKEFTGDPGKWLRGTARRLVLAWWRQKRKMPEDLAQHLETIADESDDASIHVAGREFTDALHHCLGELPEEDRHLVKQRYENGDPIVRIAGTMRLHAGTIRVRLHRIRQALKQCVESVLGEGVGHEA